MNIKEIKELITLMNENGLVELEIEKEGMRIRLRKVAQGQEEAQGSIIVEREKIPAPPAGEISAEAKMAAQKTIEIKAPMVGTFYRSPAPEAPPYIEVGQVIEPGQVICIIEAMKLMNEIEAEISGTVRKILVENAKPIEYNQPLFLVDPK